MGKKQKQKTTKENVPEPAVDAISSLGWKIIALGAASVVVGFFVLSKVDRMGRNWAADASPLLIVAGYLFIGLGIFAEPAQEKGGDLPSSPPPAQP